MQRPPRTLGAEISEPLELLSSPEFSVFPICSPLALAQAYLTRDLLKKNFSELAIDGALEICIIKVIMKGYLGIETRSFRNIMARELQR
jgi:hypothetical protein